LVRLKEYVATPANIDVRSAIKPNDTSVLARSPRRAGRRFLRLVGPTPQVWPMAQTFPPGGSQKGEESDPPGGNHPVASIPSKCDDPPRILCVLCNDLGTFDRRSAE
jgi:hypothetical protein